MMKENKVLQAFLKAQFVDDDTERDTALSWQKNAMCKQTDPDIFFPEKGRSSKNAKRICAECDWVSYCLEYALENDETFGIWGGTSENERRKLLRRKNSS